MAIPNSIKQGSWCPEFAGQHSYTIENMKQFARTYGGECLSEVYLGAKEYLKWRCGKGHEWVATFNYIKSFNKWCPKCEKEQKNINS